MPWSSISSAEKDVPSIKNLTSKQKQAFLRIVNSLIKEGTSESKAIPIAISQAKKIDKNMNKENLINAFSDFIDKYFGEPNKQLPVIKQFQEDKMEAIEWLYPLEQDDLHSERMDLEAIRGMVDSLNKAIKGNKLNTAIDHWYEERGFEIQKAWVNECDCMIGDSLVPEGWPLVKVKFHSISLWKARKEGKLLGLSIGARGSKEVVSG